MKRLNLVVILLTSISFNNCDSSLRDAQKTTNKSCNNIAEPILKDLGVLEDEKGLSYKVSIKFSLIKTALGHKGKSQIFFTKEGIKTIYQLGMPSDLPLAVNAKKNALVYCVNSQEKLIVFHSLNPLICTPNGCFEQE